MSIANKKPTGWLEKCPKFMIPYIQLARLSPPAGWLLIYFPHLFGILHAVGYNERADTFRKGLILLAESFFFSNTAHIWNDLVDAKLDALVERTRHRPIPRGAISPTAGLVFCLTQAVGVLITYSYLPGNVALYSLPYWVGSAYYPYAKRHTYWPQLVLGFCLAWGIVMGEVSMGMLPFTIDSNFPFIHNVRGSTVFLFLSDVLWTVLYDTIYSHQDYADDMKAGILSLAVLFRGQTKPLLWTILSLMTTTLAICGKLDEASMAFYALTLGASVGSLALMIARVDLADTKSCWWWFSNGFWSAGSAIAAGLFAENVLIPGRI